MLLSGGLFLLCGAVSQGLWRQTPSKTPVLDSLRVVLQEAKTDQQLIAVCNELCMAFMYEHPDSAMAYAERGLVIAREINDEQGISLSLNRIGSVYLLKGDYGNGLTHLLNSLRLAEKVNNKLLIVRSLNSLGAVYLMQENYPKAISSFEQLVVVARELKNVKGEAVAYNNLAEIYLNTGDYDLSFQHSLKALEIAETIDKTFLKGSIWSNMAAVHYHNRQYAQAEELFKNAKALNDSLRQFTQYISTQTGLARVYRKQNLLDLAEAEALAAYQRSVSLKVKEQERDVALELKEIYQQKKDFRHALEYFEKYQVLKDQISNEFTRQRINNLQSEYLLEKQDAEIKLLTERRELQQYITIILLSGTFLLLIVVFVVVRSLRSKHKANMLLTERNREIVEQREELRVQADNLQEANKLISAKNEAVQTAYNNIELLSTIGLKITSTLSVETIIETVYEHVNQLMDANGFGIGIYNPVNHGIDFIGYLEKGKKIPYHTDYLIEKEKVSVWCFTNGQELFMNNLEKDFAQLFPNKKISIVAGEVPRSVIYLPLIDPKNRESVGVITVQSFHENAYSDYHVSVLRNLSIYASIAIQNARNFQQLDRQKVEIASQNEQITKSITYAQRIQQAILPSDAMFRKLFADHFILYRPKDIVSGDFYWMHETEDQQGQTKIIFAVVDCTGHGIPGAFMSLIGNALLNQVVIDRGTTHPAQILTGMHQGIRQALKQDRNDNRDGMDMAVCVFDLTERTLEYAGARIPLLYFQQGVLQVMKPNRVGIGGDQFDRIKQFEAHKVSLTPDTRVYLFSDGFQDQFGGPEKRKFMVHRLREAFVSLQSLPMQSQKEQLNYLFESWMRQGKEIQVDDVMIIGGKIH